MINKFEKQNRTDNRQRRMGKVETDGGDVGEIPA